MKRLLVLVVLCAFVTSDPLTCYQCSDEDDPTNCVLDPTTENLDKLSTSTCSWDNSALAGACAKYTIYLINGATKTYRDCLPKHYGGLEGNEEICSFVETLISPIKSRGLISDFKCDTCETIKCNT